MFGILSTNGMLATNEREYIIIILTIYLIYNNIEEKYFVIILLIILITHIYKLYNNFTLNNEIYKNNIEAKIYNIILFISLILLIFYPNNINYVIAFSILYTVTDILTHKILINSTNYNLDKSKPIIPHKITILISSVLIILYKDKKYNWVLWTEFITHLLTLILF